MAMKDDEVEGNYQAKKFPLLGAAVNRDCLVENGLVAKEKVG